MRPRDFLSRRGVPLNVEFDWDFMGPDAYSDASFIHANIHDNRHDGIIARCKLIRYGSEWHAVLRSPFIREKAMVNAIRKAADDHQIGFWPQKEHPSSLQRMEVPPPGPSAYSLGEAELERFLAAKVYWLGFRRGDKQTKVWTGDPWDADYLGVKPTDLIRAAQVLGAENKLVLQGSFACIGDALLKRPGHYRIDSCARCDER